MTSDLLSPEIQQFITENTGVDISRLALTKNPFPEVDWQKILIQIAARTKAKDKLPTWFLHSNILYPPKISVEQTSSETTAEYKSKLVSGHSLIDMTGGFGVDAHYFAKRADKVLHCELNPELSEIVRHNASIMGSENISFFAGDSVKALHGQQFDWMYVDPSRRSESKGKVFMLADCLPNVPENLELYLRHTANILVKTAPILDITAGLSELQNVAKIHIVAVDNEVKELLWHISRGFSGTPYITAVNIAKLRTDNFEFHFENERESDARYSLPKKYLYEPNAAIMKSGAFDQVGVRFDIEKLHKHSHLYTSHEVVEAFPGRIFEIQNAFAYTKPNMKKHLEGRKANITARNFPDKVEVIRKKWKIADGGSAYCFFTTNLNDDKIALICTKIN